MSTPAPATPRRPTSVEPRFVLLVAGVTAVVLVATMAVSSLSSADRHDAAAERAATVRYCAHRLMISLYGAESSQRGYLLTGDATYQESYRRSVHDVDDWLGQLSRYAGNRHAEQVVVVQTMVNARVTELASTMQQASSGDRREALALIRTGAGRRAMNDILGALDAIIGIQNASRVDNLSGAEATGQLAMFVILVGSSLAVIALVVGITTLRRRTHERERALAEVTRQSDELERRGVELGGAVAALARVNGALQRSNHDLDQFAYVASHDLKAPLRGISSLATWVEEDLAEQASPEVREHLRLLRSRVERLELLIDGILQYARAGRDTADRTLVDVGELVGGLHELVAPPAGVELIVEPGPWPTLHTHRTQLQQVWMNLVTNAYAHGRRPDGSGRVSLACTGQGGDGAWAFCVRDDGPGIEERFHERIFDVFQRLDSRDRSEGAGIGLAIVRKLVLDHHGQVRVESAPGKGTAIHFTWSDTEAP